MAGITSACEAVLSMGGIPSIFLLSAASALVSIVAFFIVSRFLKPIDVEKHQQFLDAMLNIVGTLVSILLGLLVAAALDRYQALDDSIDTEAANISEIVRITSGLQPVDRDKLRALCFQYSEQVVNDEWPAMAKGEESKKVFLTYAKLVVAIANFRPDNDGESNLHQALITSIQEVGDCRRKRILALHSNWTNQLMPMLITCAIIVLVFAFLYVRKGAVLHAVLICFVSIALGGNIGLVFVLSNPFKGDWKLLPRGFMYNIELLKTVTRDPDFTSLLNPPATKKESDDDDDDDDKKVSKSKDSSAKTGKNTKSGKKSSNDSKSDAED